MHLYYPVDFTSPMTFQNSNFSFPNTDILSAYIDYLGQDQHVYDS